MITFYIQFKMKSVVYIYLIKHRFKFQLAQAGISLKLLKVTLLI